MLLQQLKKKKTSLPLVGGQVRFACQLKTFKRKEVYEFDLKRMIQITDY